MAASNDEVDHEEFLNCTVCLFAFDELNRKPKFLSCFHTFCLLCMKVHSLIYIYNDYRSNVYYL